MDVGQHCMFHFLPKAQHHAQTRTAHPSQGIAVELNFVGRAGRTKLTNLFLRLDRIE